jgi:hypothetical protein
MGYCAMGQRIIASNAATWWTDDSGVTHICESAAPLSNELLIWTLCDQEVETGRGFVPTRHDEVSCSKCAAADGVLKRRAQAGSHEPTLL